MVGKLITILSLFLAFGCSPSDSKIRSSVVKLASKQGSCSGTQVEAPSGKKYILTAGHCKSLAEGGLIPVQTEDGRSYFSKIIEEDGKSDLLLLEAAPGIPAVKIAKDISRHQHLKSFTHGNGYPTYSTEGEYVGEDIVQFIMGEIASDADKSNCNQPKNKIESLDYIFMQIEVCTVRVVESVTTVKLVPGSSGGLIANDKGELVGVCSAGSSDFNYLVTLKDIQSFMSKY